MGSELDSTHCLANQQHTDVQNTRSLTCRPHRFVLVGRGTERHGVHFGLFPLLVLFVVPSAHGHTLLLVVLVGSSLLLLFLGRLTVLR